MTRRRSRGEGSIYQNKAGLWVGQLRLPDGKKRVKYAKDQKTVRDWLIEERKKITDGMYVEDVKLSFGDYITRYLDEVVRHNVRPKTYEAYESLVRVHIKPELGAIKLNLLRPDHIQKFYSKKLESGLSKRTVQFMHSIIHKALDQALKWNLVVRNVSTLTDPPSPKRKSPVTWDAEQAKCFLEAVKYHRWYPIYLLAIYCGLREGEILGLHHEDIDLLHKTIYVRHAVQSLKGSGLVITEPKTQSAKRAVTIPGNAVSVLVEYLYNKKGNQGLIFTTSTGRPISPRNLVRHFKAEIEKAGLPEIRFHDLRHTHASLLLQAGVHPKLVQERLGHSQISLTLDTYSHVLPGLQDEVADKLDGILG